MIVFAVYCQSYARWKEAQEHSTSGGSAFETDKGHQQQTPWVGIANLNQKLRWRRYLGVMVNGKGNKIKRLFEA